MQTYRLGSGGVECDERGLFVGGVALLERDEASAGFEARGIEVINEELSRRYDAPIDAKGKLEGVAFVAHCLKRGDLALAQIGALMLRLPDPPSSASSGVEGRGSERFELFATLDASGLLKVGDWDEDEHPRTGAPPNPGWFAPKPKIQLASNDAPQLPTRPEPRGWRLRVQSALAWLGRSGRFAALWMRVTAMAAERASFLVSLLEYGLSFFANPALEPSTGDIVADEYGAEDDPPKTLDELQKPPNHYQLGYDQHHIVEQNPANIAKRLEYWTLLLRKFGRAAIDDPSNIVWVPRRKHWRITAIYNSKEAGDPLGRLHRQVVNQLDFASQREAGLAALREAGVLK